MRDRITTSRRSRSAVLGQRRRPTLRAGDALLRSGLSLLAGAHWARFAIAGLAELFVRNRKASLTLVFGGDTTSG